MPNGFPYPVSRPELTRVADHIAAYEASLPEAYKNTTVAFIADAGTPPVAGAPTDGAPYEPQFDGIQDLVVERINPQTGGLEVLIAYGAVKDGEVVFSEPQLAASFGVEFGEQGYGTFIYLTGKNFDFDGDGDADYTSTSRLKVFTEPDGMPQRTEMRSQLTIQKADNTAEPWAAAGWNWVVNEDNPINSWYDINRDGLGDKRTYDVYYQLPLINHETLKAWLQPKPAGR